MWRRSLFVLISLLVGQLLWAKPTGPMVNVTDFGAKGDGVTMNTAAIQAAIDQASDQKIGLVIVPKGVFLTGSLILKNNVELRLSKGAVLLGSTNPSDYRAVLRNNWKALIMSDGGMNMAITGKGKIDGQGRELALRIDSLFYAGKLDSSLYSLKERRPVPHARPQLLQFTSCMNITVSGITICNAASWVQTYDLCSNVTLDRIRVVSVSYWNNDGIDIIDCKAVRITNSYINASDDGICVKSYQRGPEQEVMVENLYIANCTVRSSASAVKLGTSSFGGFKNVKIENIKVFDTYRSAIAIECWETGTVENILVQNVRAKNTGNALFIRLNKRGVFKDYPMGTLKNVVIRNLKATIPYGPADLYYEMRGPAEPFFHNTFPVSISGMPGANVEDVRLENIQISYPGYGNPAYANLPVYRIEDVPEKIEEYPEFSMFGELPAWGFYVRHAHNIYFKNVKIKIRLPDYRPAFVFDQVTDLNLENIIVKGNGYPEWYVERLTEFGKMGRP